MASEKVSVYDPTVDAYREVTIEIAVKFIEAAKALEAELRKTGKLA
jgi:CHASE3 domain sensor protein